MALMEPGTSVVRLDCAGTETTIQECRRESVDNCTALAGIQCRGKRLTRALSNRKELYT